MKRARLYATEEKSWNTPSNHRWQARPLLAQKQACDEEWPQLASTYALHHGLGGGKIAFPEVRPRQSGSAAAVLGKALAEGGVTAAEKVFPDLLARRVRAGPVIDENDWNNLGYKLLKQMNIESALYVFEKNAVLFPTSANVYDSLGEARATAGRREQAIESYRKAIELDPTNAGARTKLKLSEKRHINE